VDDFRSAKSANGDAGLSGDHNWEGWGVGGQQAGDIFDRGGARLIASRRGRHLVRGVVAAVGDTASEGGRQSVLAFFGVDEDG